MRLENISSRGSRSEGTVQHDNYGGNGEKLDPGGRGLMPVEYQVVLFCLHDESIKDPVLASVCRYAYVQKNNENLGCL